VCHNVLLSARNEIGRASARRELFVFELGWILIKLLLAALRTKVVGLAVMLAVRCGLWWIHVHTANWVFHHVVTSLSSRLKKPASFALGTGLDRCPEGPIR
jgi:hypothetical protein